MALRAWNKCVWGNINALRTHFQNSWKRNLLTHAYSCQEAWKKRLASPVLRKVDPSSFTIQLQERFERDHSVAPVDIDIFANKLDEIDPIQLDFAQDLFARFHQCPNGPHVFESTSHGVIRALIHFEEMDRLMDMLTNKLKYGIFFDDYTANIVMDMFIEKGNYYDAAQVAYDLMYQEDFINPIKRHLAWLACDKHWRSGQATAASMEDISSDTKEDEEETWIPVRFITNPWYDDHWDIQKDSLLLGKTFTAVTRGDNSVLARSYNLVGWGLYEKFDEGLKMLHELAESDQTDMVAKEAVDAFTGALEAVVTQEPREMPEPGLQTMNDVLPYITEEEKSKYFKQLEEVKTDLLDRRKICEYDLQDNLRDTVQKIIDICQEQDIKDQEVLFDQWNKIREESVKDQLEQYKIEQRKLKVVERLNALQEKEERLRYFDEQQKIMLGISRVPKFVPVEDVAEEEQFVAAPGERGKSKN